MKITCPNCQKKYSIDKAKLPSVVKTAKCKACGQLIPLDSASSKPSIGQPAIIKITCHYCGKNYNLRQDKVPPDTKSINCISCGHPLPLEQKSGSAPVHSLKKETSGLGSDPSAGKPRTPDAVLRDMLGFSCAGCGKKYKIRRNKIPPDITAVKCKACGHIIRLPHSPSPKAAEDPSRAREHQTEPHRARPDVIAEHVSPSTSGPRNRKWRFAAAAVILLAVILGVSASLDLIRLDGWHKLFPRVAENRAATSTALQMKPFLALNLNFPIILDVVANRLDKDKKTLKFEMMMSILKSLDLKQVELYLYAEAQNQILPVILALGSNRQHLEKILNSEEPFKIYFERKSRDSYLLNKAALSDAEKSKFPVQPYQVTLIEDGALLAPVSLSGAIKKNLKLLQNSTLARFAKSIATQADLATIAIRIPASLHQGWENKIQNHPAMQSMPQAAMIAGMGSAIMSQLTGSLKSVELLGLGFRFNGQKGRALTYAQQFRPGVDGEKIFRQLAAENLADAEIDGVIRNLIELFQDHRFRHTIDFNDNRLDLGFSWSENEDNTFLTALTTATIGQLLAGSMELTPTIGAVDTRYTPEPNWVTAVDVDRLKAAIPNVIRNSLFPGNYWDTGDNPMMTLDLDTIEIPNAALAELTYEVKTIQSADGKDVLRVEESKVKPRIQPGSLFPENISLNIKKDTPPDALGEATIDFHLSLPSSLEIFDFRMGDKKGSVKEAAGIRVTLGRLEKDVARVSSSSGKSMRLIAYDQSGKALASRESMSTSASASARFQGIIDTLKVVVIRDMLEYPFEVEVDLNAGKALALSREAEVPARIRYNPHPVPAYVDFTADDTMQLNVTWTEGQEDAWNDSLSVKLPRGPFSGHAVWEVHFFGNNKPQFLAGSSAQSFKDVSYTLDKDALKQVSAAFGKVQLNLHSDISRLIFFQKGGTQPAVQKLPPGDEVSVTFNKNKITYSTGSAEVIQTAAYDARGKRLKQDPYTRNQGDKRIIYFWGLPVKFEIDLSTTTIKKLIPFEIRQRPVNEKAYLAYRQVIDNQHEVVKIIKAIDRARRGDRSYYGDDLAGLHYLYDQKKKTPMRLVSQDVAHSDPAGQNRFGYTAKPYKGYYFTVLSGIEVNGVNKSYNRRLKKSSFAWQKGTITTTALTRHPDLAAIPEDSSQPTFFLQWGQVFMKPLNGEKFEYLPDGYYNKGWVEAKFIESE